MIIEFIAVPGSGKSYFSDKLYTHLKNKADALNISLFNRNDIDARKRARLLAFSNNKILIRIHLLFNILKVIDFHIFRCIISLLTTSGHSFKVKRKRIMYLLDIILNYRIINDIRKEYDNKCVFVLDEGLLHVSSICMKECNSTNLKKFFKKLKRKQWYKTKQLFVFVDCNTDVLFDRLTKRAEGWPGNWKNLSTDAKNIELEKSYLKFDTKKKYIIKTKNKKRYYLIDNSVYFENHELFFKKILKKINI